MVETSGTVVRVSTHQIARNSTELHDQGADALCQHDGAIVGLVSAD